MSLPRSSCYYKPKEKVLDETSLVKRIEELVEEFDGNGYSRSALSFDGRGSK